MPRSVAVGDLGICNRCGQVAIWRATGRWTAPTEGERFGLLMADEWDHIEMFRRVILRRRERCEGR